MRVRPIDLTRVLGYKPAAVSVAVKRGKLNKGTDGLIDLTDAKNKRWVADALLKNNRVVPDDLTRLFEGVRLITETEKEQSEILPLDNAAPDTSNNPSAPLPQVDPELAKNKNALERFRAEKMKYDAEASKTKALEARGQLVSINPFGKFIMGLVGASREQVLNAIPNISQLILDEIKSGLDLNKTDSELLLNMNDTWTTEIEKIFMTIDTDVKTKIQHAKRKTREQVLEENAA